MISMSRVKWLKNRLATMGPAEVSSRLADVGRHVMLRTFLGRMQNIRLNGVGDQPNTPIINIPLTGMRKEKDMPIIAHADRWLSHRASFFSLQDVPLGDPIDWHQNYTSGTRGPMKYSGLINHRDSTEVGDVKYVWELNRLQHLVLLALAFRQTNNVIYRDEIVSQTLSWISSNPFMIGINWKSPLEAALRLISWAFVSCLLENEFPSSFQERMRVSIYQHQYFIWKFFSKQSSANNHLIGEMAGLYVASIIWPHYRESKAWRAMGRQTLILETMRQVGSDGVGRELATEYQLFILEFLVIAGALGQLAGDPFPETFWRRLNSMITFLSSICNRSGNFPMFGDGDSGQVIALPHTPQERIRSLVCLGRLCGEQIPDPVDFCARTRLLLWGQSPDKLPFTQQIGRQQGLQAFPQGGYYILADGQYHDDEMMIVFDAGPLGLPPLYAHGHADALSFWLSYRGEEFLVDPGTFCYYGEESWRDYFRSTAAHNTARIDGKDQSVASGRFQWSHVARSQVSYTAETDECVEIKAYHDGYMRLADPVIHHRHLRLFKHSKRLLICDRFDSASDHDIEVFFHFGERCHVEQTGLNSFMAAVGTTRLHITLDSRAVYRLLRASEEPRLGWISRTYGVKVPSFVLVGRARLTGSTRPFLSEILPV